MFSNNKISSLKKGDGTLLDVVDIFATFQGEGIYTGYPAVFIRLGGCNLTCKFCDTEFDNFKELELEKILSKVQKLAFKNNKKIAELVVITGGEPFLQPIEKLCSKLLEMGLLVQIETNGTLYRQLPEKVDIICSPKNPTGKYGMIRDDLLKRISAFKFLISAQNKNYNFIPEIAQNKYQTPVYLQPIDEYNEEKNRNNMDLALKLAKKYGCRLSLQTHKIWEIE